MLAHPRDIDTGWNIYQSITGTDLPLYVVAKVAKSRADHYAQYEKDHEVMGEAAEALGEKTLALMRKIEFKEGRPRPDLSYPGPEMAAKAPKP